jgi:pentapeptide repeat protein
MTLLSVKSPPDQEDRSVDERPPCPSSDSSARAREGAAPPVRAVRGPEKLVWIDLLRLNRAQVEEVCQTLGFSPEVIAPCLLPIHTLKVVAIDSSLFLVTFLAVRSPHSLFALHGLKVCVAPGFLLTVHSCSSAACGLRHLPSPDRPRARDGRTGSLLRLILEGTVQSYETIGTELRTYFLGRGRPTSGRTGAGQTSRQQMRQKGAQFARFLRQQRTFLQEVARAGSTLLGADDQTRVRWLAERAGVLARRVEEIIQTPREGKNLMEQELTVILTEAEKQTVLIGRRFVFAHFTKVDLSRAVFREADLEGAKFVQTDLRGADFRKANVQGAVFSRCDLQGADFTGARLAGAHFLTSCGLSLTMWGYIRSHGGVV